MKLFLLSFVSCGSSKTLTNEQLRQELETNYDWADLPGLGPDQQSLSSNWLGDLPGVEYDDYPQKTSTQVDQISEPLKYRSAGLNSKDEFEPDIYYFDEDYPQDSPATDEFEIATNGRRIQEPSISDDSHTSSYGDESSDEYLYYEYDEYSQDISGKGDEFKPNNEGTRHQAGRTKVDLQMIFITRTEKDLEEKAAKVLTQHLPSKFWQPYDLIEWHFEPHANDKNLKLNTRAVIDGQNDDTSFLIILPDAPDGLYHFQLKYENKLLNATIFNVQTVTHESTCDCLSSRNLFKNEPTKQVRRGNTDSEFLTEDKTEETMKNAAETRDGTDLTNHQMAINIKNQMSNETQNYECIVSDHPVVSPQKFHEIKAGDKYVACYEVCKTTKPNVSAFWDIDFTFCSSRTTSAGYCLRRSQLQMETCSRSFNTNCFCPEEGETQLSFITSRNNVGISTLDYYYDTIGQYYLFNMCNKC